MNIIVAVNQTNGIGFNGLIPWHNKIDMKFFKMMTYGNNVYMGRKTFESLGKPLSGRLNHVLSSKFHENCVLYNDPNMLMSRIENDPSGFVIGGESIYNMVLDAGIIKNIYISTITDSSQCDRFFKLPENFNLISSMKIIGLTIERYIKEKENERN